MTRIYEVGQGTARSSCTVNFHDTHFPYHHRLIQPLLPSPVVDQPDIVPERADAVRQMYLNTVANVDAAIGDVLNEPRGPLARNQPRLCCRTTVRACSRRAFLGTATRSAMRRREFLWSRSNMRLALAEPFGQSDLRAAIAAALAGPATLDMRPTVTRSATREVFQYFGELSYPVQIGFRGIDGGIVYDFREERARVDEGQWQEVQEYSRRRPTAGSSGSSTRGNGCGSPGERRESTGHLTSAPRFSMTDDVLARGDQVPPSGDCPAGAGHPRWVCAPRHAGRRRRSARRRNDPSAGTRIDPAVLCLDDVGALGRAHAG